MSIEQLEALIGAMDVHERAELLRRWTDRQPCGIDRPSLRDHKPASVGRVLRPLTKEDDLLDEMIDS